MNIVTHGLTSFVLARGFFPQRGWTVAVGMVVAGTLADMDGFSALIGPGAYLRWHETYTHSLVGTLVVVAIATLLTVRLGRKIPVAVTGIAVSMAVAAIVHVLLDVCQSDGVTLLWPVTARRFAADLLPVVDPWILTLLILGLMMPEIFRLVSSEIGAREKNPRGRNEAIVALALILIYVGTRFVLHTTAVAQIDAHAYKGESPRRVGAFADSLSVFRWHGIAETYSLACQLEVPVGPGQRFDPEAALCQHKPEPSAALDLAQQTTVAREFLTAARFPRATVERTEDGYEVLLKSLRDAAEMEYRQRVEARIVLDEKPQVTEEELEWVKVLGKR